MMSGRVPEVSLSPSHFATPLNGCIGDAAAAEVIGELAHDIGSAKPFSTSPPPHAAWSGGGWDGRELEEIALTFTDVDGALRFGVASVVTDGRST
jgi:hypothetical protein